MNHWQAAKQLKTTLTAAVWPDGSGQAVFGDVAISTPQSYFLRARERRLPVCIVQPTSEGNDPQHPERVIARFNIHFFADVPQDLIGQSSAVGGSRANLGSSNGRGVLELAEVGIDSIVALPKDFRLNIRPLSSEDFLYPSDERVLAQRTVSVEATCRRAHFYQPARLLVATVLGGGQIGLAWALPGARYDRYSVVIRRASGATAPTSATSGTSVVSSTASPTSYTDSPGVGQFSYALFIGYDENGVGAVDYYSAGVNVTATAT